MDAANRRDPDRPPIGALFGQLVEHGEAFVRAEVALYRAQAGQKLLSARTAAILFVAALTILQGALIALIIGLMIALAPALGTGWAILAVVGGAAVIAALLAWAGVASLKRLTSGNGAR